MSLKSKFKYSEKLNNGYAIRIEIPPFYWEVFVTYGKDSLDKIANKNKLDLNTLENVLGTNTLAFHVKLYNGNQPFSLIHFSSTFPDYGTITHECIHAIHDMLESRGVPISKENTEIIAYSVEWLSEEISSNRPQ